MLTRGRLCLAAALTIAGCAIATAKADAQILIIGNDEKPGWDKDGKPMLNPSGHDSLSIIDMSKPGKLNMIATIPLDNTIVGPPTNLAISPARDIALVANSVNEVDKDGKPSLVSDDRLFVVDLKANPPAISATLHLGKRPSGMAIAPNGRLALVANRDDGTISVLSIDGKDVKVTGAVTVGAPTDSVAAVAITPDGKRALVAKSLANKVAIVAIDGDKVTYDKQDLPTGLYPYNVVISPNGKLALTADNGNGGGPDGNLDTVGVIDLEANPPRVIDHVTVTDSPEGLAFSPRGDLAASVDSRGSNSPKDRWFYHPGGAVSLLRINGKTVTNAGTVTVGALPEGAVFSPDGNYLYVGNFIDRDLSVLRVSGAGGREIGRIKLPGQPASMRGGPQ